MWNVGNYLHSIVYVYGLTFENGYFQLNNTYPNHDVKDTYIIFLIEA